MRKLLIILMLVTTLTLSSCNFIGVDYTSFNHVSLTSYYQAENISNNRYVLYYYDSTDEKSEEIKNEILSFFNGFSLLDFYLVDTSTIETEVSNFGGYDTEPIIYVVSSKSVLETYTGNEIITDFITKYTLEPEDFDYDLFESQHVTSYEEILSIENDSYILYYYLDSCPHCIASKPYFLPWALTKSAEDIYFMEGSTVQNADQLPTELIILNSGTPILVLMSNGKFANEYYSGREDVLNYIEEVGDGDIVCEENQLEYSDFEDRHIDYTDTLTMSNDVYIEYYYSPYCSHCNAIKNDLLYFFNDLETTEYYLIDTSSADGLNKIDDFVGTPALYIIKNNIVIDSFIGSIEIPNFIDDVEDGNVNLDDY